MLLTGGVIFAIACLHYHGDAVVFGPDAENILAPLFFDISRSIGQHGLWAGMYAPGQFAGLPLWSSPWFHPLYPFYFNWLGSDTSIFDTVARLQWVDYLHLSIYGMGTYLLCREIGIRPWLAIAMGVSSPWLPAVQSTLPWPPILASFAWLPWIVAFQIRLYRNQAGRQRVQGILGLALTFSLLVYAQPAQNMVLIVVGSAVMWICMVVMAFRGDQESGWRSLLNATYGLAIAGVVVLVLCGSYLFGVAAFHAGSIRWVSSTITLIGHQRMPLAALQEFALKLSDVAATAIYVRGNTAAPWNPYVGGVLLFCAVAGVAVGRRDRRLIALLVSAAVAMLFCFYHFTPVLQWLPVANKVREVQWWSCYVVVVLFPLGGYGLQQLLDLQSADATRTSLSRGLAWMPLAGFVLALGWVIGSTVTPKTPNIWLLCISFGALFACLWQPTRTRRLHQPVSVGIVLLSAFVPMMLHLHDRPSLQQSLLRQPDHVERRDEATRIAAKITDGNAYRFAVSPEIADYKNFTVTLANLGLRGIRGDESPQEYDKFRLLFFPTPVVSNLYGVKYTVIPNHDRVMDDVPIDVKVSLRIDPHALPRLFFLEGGAKMVASPIDALLNVTAGDVVPFFVAPKDLPAGIDFSPYVRGDAVVQPVQVSFDNTVDIKGSFVTNGPVLLVLSEDPAGRWRAMIDGKPIESFRINGFQTAFPVTSAGQHTVEIRRPAHLL
ncbi:MAG: hypothetical protein WA777_02500 [Rhodanobacter sp.]